MAIVKESIIKAREEDIIQLVNKHLPFVKKFDSIVAEQELGNQEWTVSVSSVKDVTGSFEEVNSSTTYRTPELLDILCTLGHLEAGDYLIDCTW